VVVAAVGMAAEDANLVGIEEDSAGRPRETRERRPIAAGGTVDV
jgi:hypothetical protein